MKPSSERKSTRFFIINPISDRRMEIRFESREPIQIRDNDTGELHPGYACDVGRRGMRIETKKLLDLNSVIHILFPKTPDAVQCFGRVVWSRPLEEGTGFMNGLDIQSWHGIIDGTDSWKNFKGSHLKRDRRRSSR